LEKSVTLIYLSTKRFYNNDHQEDPQ